MTTKTKLSYLLIAATFLIGLALRLYRLDQNIPELYADEAGHYYYKNYLTDSGQTLTKKLLSITFTATNIFGLNPFGARFMSAFFGSVLILVGFYFAKSLDKASGSKKYMRVALVAGLLFATLPWGYAISRIGHTHIPIVTILGLAHIIFFINSRSLLQKLLSLMPLLVGTFYYPTLALMSPLILLVPAKQMIWDNQKHKKLVFVSGSLFVVTVLFTMINRFQILSNTSRAFDLSIWRDINVTADANLYRGIARQSSESIFSFNLAPESVANKIYFNFPLSVISKFTENYLSFYTTNNLFLKGDPVLRHSTGMVGNFYFFLLPFMLYGSYVFFMGTTSKDTKTFIALWLVASPIPAAITKDGAGYLLRSISLYPILTFFCAQGLVYSFNCFKSVFVRIIYGLLLLAIFVFSAHYYFFGYFHVYPSLAKNSFEYGFKGLSDFQRSTGSKLLIIWEDKYPISLFCFWQNLPYDLCKAENLRKSETVGETRVDMPTKNVYFTLPKTEKDLEAIVTRYTPSHIALSDRFLEIYPEFFKDYKIVDTIKNPDDTSSFYIYQIEKRN